VVMSTSREDETCCGIDDRIQFSPGIKTRLCEFAFEYFVEEACVVL